MSVLVVGISHKSAPVSLLERLALDSDAALKLVADVVSGSHVTEATAIVTCNRLEVYAEVDRFHGSVEDVSRLLVERAGQTTGELSAPLRPLRRGRGVPPLQRRGRPGVDGRRRGPDPRPDP